MIIKPDELELHDGRIIDLSVDFVGRRLNINVEAYIDQSESSRLNVELRFFGVSNFSSILNFIALGDNFKSGNINYWISSSGHGFYLYFQDGCIQVNSSEMEVEVFK